MITGVSGTVGRELLVQLETKGVSEIIGIDNNENEIFFLSQNYLDKKSVKFQLVDICDREALEHAMRGCDIVLHAAALKHVGLCENAPRAAVNTNILGIQNIIDAATSVGVERVLFTSSDKAVNPTNVMGTSKLMGERLMTAAHMSRAPDGPVFASTRFGNVLGSRGSVIPVFKNQIAKGGPVTVRGAEMTRFIMTLSDAVNLVLETATLFSGGEVFITKMPVARIMDLAEIMIEESGKQGVNIKLVPPQPGEKMYEELMNDEEVRHALESDRFFIVTPALSDKEFVYKDVQTFKARMPYTSANAEAMDKEVLRQYLITHGLIETSGKTETKLKVVNA
jgi:FlaA1/EpsC-like NDP-sugar epimerase